MSLGEIIINKVQIDWITGTTFDAELWRDTVKQLQGHVNESPRPDNRGGYRGSSGESIWYGQGTQQEQEHFMIVASGAGSPAAFPDIASRLKVTRLDIQVTIELPDWYKSRALVDTLRYGKWPGRRRVIPMREDGKGGTTVYIGSPTSDKMIRIYVKGEYYLRYEIQYRRGYAEDAARHCLIGGQNAMSAILATELTKLPPHPVFERFGEFCKGTQVVAAYKANPEMVARLKWLSTLLPGLQRMANDHDYGDTVRGWFHDIIENSKRNGA